MKKRDQEKDSAEKQTIEVATPEEVEEFAAKKAETAEATSETAGTEPASQEPAAPPQEEINWKDKFLRAKADYQNLQRRATEEQRAAVRYAITEFARSLLEVIDDFERTLEAGDKSQDDASLVSGIKLVYEKLLKFLRDHHVEPIESLGQPFDPQFHEAMMQEVSEDHPPNTVIREIQKGYRLHDRVLRPGRVIISKALEPAEDEPAAGGFKRRIDQGGSPHADL